MSRPALDRIASVRTIETGYSLCEFLEDQMQSKFMVVSQERDRFEVWMAPGYPLPPKDKAKCKELVAVFKASRQAAAD
jgi:hypothetical protein